MEGGKWDEEEEEEEDVRYRLGEEPGKNEL
jgi:hypothetical protein